MSLNPPVSRYNPPTEEQLRTSWNPRMRRHSAGRYVKFTDYSIMVDQSIDLDIERHDNQVRAEVAESEREEWKQKAMAFARHAMRDLYSCGGIPCRCENCERDLMADGSGHAPGCVVAAAEELVKQLEGAPS